MLCIPLSSNHTFPLLVQPTSFHPLAPQSTVHSHPDILPLSKTQKTTCRRLCPLSASGLSLRPSVIEVRATAHTFLLHPQAKILLNHSPSPNHPQPHKSHPVTTYLYLIVSSTHYQEPLPIRYLSSTCQLDIAVATKEGTTIVTNHGKPALYRTDSTLQHSPSSIIYYNTTILV